MIIRITNISKASIKEWDKIWQNCNYSTYFHSHQWAEIWNVISKGRIFPAPRMLAFSDGKKALIPLSCIKKRWGGLIKEHISSPEGTYGGWISQDELQIEHAALLTDYMLKECGNLSWLANPYDKNILKIGIKSTTNITTHMLNLSLGFEEVSKYFSRGNISSTHKAQRHGIIIKLASDIKDWQSYFRIYEDSLIRWGDKVSSRYDWKLFEEIHRRQSSFIRLWLASHEGTIVSGALCFYAKKHVDYWHGASLKSHFSYRPANLLFHEVIKDACQKGYSWFDFNPSGGHEGVSAFKESFGTQILNCPVIYVGDKRVALYYKIMNYIKR